MWLLIDNYDSFTYILYHYLLALHKDIHIVKNDELTVDEIATLNPVCIILSPGPRTPEDAGVTMQVIQHFIGKIPLLGICLGHQALGVYLGAQLSRAKYPMHGKTSELITLNNHELQLPVSCSVMRYHSLVLEKYHHIGHFTPLAYSKDDGALMWFYSPHYKCMGFQFHPESIGTEKGMDLLRIWHHWAFATNNKG